MPEPTIARTATKVSGQPSEGPPEVRSGLTVAVALRLAVVLALEAARIGRRLLERRARDARSFGELPSFPNDKELSPCPHSHHTSSSPSSSSSWPCSLTEWSITLWAATSLASPTG